MSSPEEELPQTLRVRHENFTACSYAPAHAQHASGSRQVDPGATVNEPLWQRPISSTAWWRRRVRVALVVLVIALACLGTLIESSLPSPTVSVSSVPDGLFVGSQNPSDVLALGRQLGVTPTIMTVYADGSCYCTYTNPPTTSIDPDARRRCIDDV